MKYEELTGPQKEAVDKRGNIIVSAAAGSGKTAVLVERILHRLTDPASPLSADKMLVVTFTVAAAAEMRARLEKALMEYCREHPTDLAAKRQKMLLQTAKIGTIDSFCMDLVRENFEKCGVDPNFRIADEGQEKQIQSQSADQVLELHYAAKDPEFLYLLDAYGSFFDDSGLKKELRAFYDKNSNQPFPKEVIRRFRDRYRPERLSEWMNSAMNRVSDLARIGEEQFCRAIEICRCDPKLEKSYGPGMEGYRQYAESLSTAASRKEWNALFGLLKEPPVFRASYRGECKVQKERVGRIRDDFLKKDLERMKKMIPADYETALRQLKEAGRMTRKFLELCEEYAVQYEASLQQAGVLTFSGVEHLAFSMLCRYQDQKPELTPMAGELISRFEEVLVDEYQDVNDLQDTFFRILSDDGRHLFTVGDVKQSIYGFRGSNPSNFLSRLEAADESPSTAPNPIQPVVLDKNFRCKPEICAFVNEIFERLMTPETGKIHYANHQQLVAGAVFPQVDAPAAEVHIVTSTEQRLSAKQAEAQHIADTILGVMASGKVIHDKTAEGGLRQARFSDFAVLIQNFRNTASFLAETLQSRGIPVCYQKKAFLETREISLCVSLLSCISNPTRDVPLLSVLLSPIGGFSADDVAYMRSAHRDGTLYAALIAAANRSEGPCREFCRKLEELRRLAALYPLGRLIREACRMTGLWDCVSFLEDSSLRRANLERLASLAENFESTGICGIEPFLRFLKRSEENGTLSGAGVSGGEDTVKLYSIHGSKGLQFPVCIIGFLSTRFNEDDTKARMIAEPEIGMAFSYYDEEGEKTVPISKTLISEELKEKKIEENMRLLYVGMTRAQDRLILTCYQESPEKTLAKLMPLEEESPTKFAQALRMTNNYADWILMCLLRCQNGRPLFEICGEEPVGLMAGNLISNLKIGVYSPAEQPPEPQKQPARPQADLCRKMEENIALRYPYRALQSIPAKLSVSEIAHPEAAVEQNFSKRPDFLYTGGFSPTGRGTALHKVMQYLDFRAARQDLAAELDRLQEWEYITENERKLADGSRIQAFLNSELCGRMLNSSLLKREMRFLTAISAGEIDPDLRQDLQEEKVMVQGAVDCLFEENGALIVVDFKTDRVSQPADLAVRYDRQLCLYADACEKIFLKPVRERLIYSLYLDQTVRCKEEK